MHHEPKRLSHRDIKNLVYRLKNLTCSRFDQIEAAQLIEKALLGPRFHHTKRGTNYTVVGEARLNHAEVVPTDGEMLTLYLGDDGIYSVRRPQEFNDGRFVPLKE